MRICPVKECPWNHPEESGGWTTSCLQGEAYYLNCEKRLAQPEQISVTVPDVLAITLSPEVVAKWRASLQERGGEFVIYFRLHDAMHGLRLQDALELRDLLDSLLRHAGFEGGDTGDDRTKWMSSFTTKDDLMQWLAKHNVHANQAEIDRAWTSREEAVALGVPKDYKLIITGRKRPFLRIFRRGPKRVSRVMSRKESA